MIKSIHHNSWGRLVLSKGKWYLLSSLFTKGLGLLLLPVYTRYLSPSEYGVLNTLNSVAQFLPIILSLYLDSAFCRYFHEVRNDKESLCKLFSSIYLFVLGWGGAMLLLVLFTGPFWIRNLLPHTPYNLFVLAVVPALFLQVGQLGVVFLRQNLESLRTTIIDVSTALLSVAITLPLLIYYDFGVMAKLIGSMVPAIILFVYYTYYFYKKGLLKFSLDSGIIKECLFYSIPLIPNIAGGWIAGLSDRLVLAKYSNLASVGLYSLAMNLGQILYYFQDAITQVTGAVSMSGLIHDKEQTNNKIAQLSFTLWIAMLLANLVLTLFSPEVVSIVGGNKYAGASGMIGIVGFAYVLSTQYRVFMCIVSYHKKMWLITIAGLVMAGVSLLVNLILVHSIGYYGAACSFVVATISYCLIVISCALSLENIPVRWGKSILALVLFFICVYLGINHPLWGIEGIVCRISLIAIYISFCVFFSRSFR